MLLVIFYERGKGHQPSVIFVPLDNSYHALRKPISGLLKLIKQQITPTIPQRVNLEIHRTESFTFAYPPDLPLFVLLDTATDGNDADEDDEIWLWARATNPEEDNFDDEQKSWKLFPFLYCSPPEYIWGSTPPQLWSRANAIMWQNSPRNWCALPPAWWGPPQYHPRYNRMESAGGEPRMLQDEILGEEVNSGGHGSLRAECENRFQFQMGNDPGTELWIFYEGRSGNPDDDKIGSFKLSYPQDFEHLTTVAHLLDFVRKRLDLPPPSDLDLEIYDSLYSPHSICPASRVDSVIEASTVAFKCFWIRSVVPQPLPFPQECPPQSAKQMEQGPAELKELKTERVADMSPKNMDKSRQFSSADHEVKEKIKVKTRRTGGGILDVFMFKSAEFVNDRLFIHGHIFHQRRHREDADYWKCIRCPARMAQIGQTIYPLSTFKIRLWEIHEGHHKPTLPQDVIHIVDETTADLAFVSTRQRAVKRETARAIAENSSSNDSTFDAD